MSAREALTWLMAGFILVAFVGGVVASSFQRSSDDRYRQNVEYRRHTYDVCMQRGDPYVTCLNPAAKPR